MAKMVLEQPGQATTRLSLAWLAPWIRRLIFYVALVVGWELVVRGGSLPDYALPRPLTVLGSLSDGIASGVFLQGAFISLERLAVGYLVSLVIGLILGILIGRFHVVEETVGSLVLGLQALPSICWLPLAILWFGLSEQAMIFVVVMGAVFSITLGVDTGVKNTPPVYLKAARNMGSRGLRLYTQVILPAALPAVLSGLKQGWTFAWRSLMAAELIYESVSLGNLLQQGRDLSDASQVIAVMLVIIVIGVTIDTLIFGPLERGLRERWGLIK